MIKNSLKNTLAIILFVGLAAIGNSFAQMRSDTVKQVNFRYSQNPKIKSKVENQEAVSDSPKINTAPEESINTAAAEKNDDFKSISLASKTYEIAKRATVAAASPTEIYKIDSGDVLLISLPNVPGGATDYFTVLADGTIDFPLAGEMVLVQGLTSDEVEDLLRGKIKLYENSTVAVKVREFASHKYTVLGSVEKAGEKFLQREAVPLYVVRAEAVTQKNVSLAVIKRANSSTEQINLNEPKSDDILIFPGDIIEFKSADVEKVNQPTAPIPQFYFMGGDVNAVGQRDFYSGLTLTQAILAAGGLKKPSIRKALIRRKNQEGLLASFEFDLKAIKNGEQPDPLLQIGDTIEIGK